MNAAGRRRATVAIVGGGFTGATIAYHLARGLGPDPGVEILVIEPRDGLGQGLAYSTADPSHRVNVPASRMTMDCAIEDGFQRWLDEKGVALSPGSRMADGSTYPQRGLVGAYVADHLRPLLDSGRVRHVRARAISAVKAGTYRVALDDGGVVEADHLVIATSHPPPSIPAAFAHLRGSPRLISDPSDDARLSGLARDAERVAIIGTGLTSADVIASLDRQGFKGSIRAISRRGLRSRGHAFGHGESLADFSADPARTALGLLRRVRAGVRRDAEAGLPWQAALDRVRKQAGAIWAALPEAERAKLVRRLRVWWDVHRFRVAPPVEAVLDDLIARGRLAISAGDLREARLVPDGIEIDWRPKGGAPVRERFDAVVLTTGPAHQDALGSGLLAALGRAGLVRQDPLRLGLEVTAACLAVGADGRPSPRLYVAGPLARAGVGELMGIPEVTGHAELVAARILAALEQAGAARASAENVGG